MEVIVVDNASTDNSVELAQALSLPVQWLYLPENIGFACANNLAASKAQGEFLVLLNPDTVLLCDCITPLIEYLEMHPAVGLIGGHHESMTGEWQRSFDLVPGISHEFERALNPAKYWNRLPSSPPDQPIEVGWLYGSFVVIRRSLARQIGLYNECFFLNDEDIDLSDRVRRAGLKIVYHPQRGLKHFGGVSKASSSTSHSEYRRSRRMYYRKRNGRIVEYAYLIAATIRGTRDLLSKVKRRMRSINQNRQLRR